MSWFFERIFFNPKWYDYFFIFLMFPLSIIYGTVNFFLINFKKTIDFKVPIIGIGNLIVGGSGKTPFAVSLISYIYSKRKCKIAYISRGYGRESRGLVKVCIDSEILVDVLASGDEAMLVAKECECNVYVCEDRAKAVEVAKSDGAEVIVLDDAFSHTEIKKFDIVLEPKVIKNRLPIPAGGFREFYFNIKRANIVAKEGRDFKRLIFYENLTDKMLLATAISNPSRLNAFLPDGVVGKYYLDDHSYFDEDILEKKIKDIGAKSLLVTQKDFVKMEQFKLPISVMKLQLQINSDILEKVDKYIGEKICKQK